MLTKIDIERIRVRLSEIGRRPSRPWRAALFCRVRKEDGSWHESYKLSIQKGVYGSMSAEDAALAAAAPELHRLVGELCDELERTRSQESELGILRPEACLTRSGDEDEEESVCAYPGSCRASHGPAAGLSDLTFSGDRLEAVARDFATMQGRLEAGDLDKDELGEWMLANGTALQEALARSRPAEPAAC